MQTPIRLLAAAFAFLSVSAFAQSDSDILKPATVLPIAAEAQPRLIAYQPVPEALARGAVIIQHRTEQVRLMPVFGPNAVAVSPRLGHIHVSLDDLPVHWAHTSQDPIIMVGLKPGPHKVLLEIADPVHKILTSTSVSFTVPDLAAAQGHAH